MRRGDHAIAGLERELEELHALLDATAPDPAETAIRTWDEATAVRTYLLAAQRGTGAAFVVTDLVAGKLVANVLGRCGQARDQVKQASGPLTSTRVARRAG